MSPLLQLAFCVWEWGPCSPSPPNKLFLHYLACLQFMFLLHTPKPSILWAQPRPCPSHDAYSHPSVWAVKCLAHTFGCQCLPKHSWCACLISPAQLKASRDQWLYLSCLSISPVPRTISTYLGAQNVLIEWKEDLICSYCVCLQFRNLIIWTSWNLKSCVPQLDSKFSECRPRIPISLHSSWHLEQYLGSSKWSVSTSCLAQE